jgi:hypothetical protein
MPVAIHPSHSGFRAIQKIGTIQASSGIIRGIPAKDAEEPNFCIFQRAAPGTGANISFSEYEVFPAASGSDAAVSKANGAFYRDSELSRRT